MPVSERGRLALLVVVVIVAGCGSGGADPGTVPGEEVPGPLVSCTRGERDVFPESRLSGDPLSREELVDVAMGAGLAESLPVGGFGPEEGFYSTADGFLILDDSMIGSVIDGRVVGYFYLEQRDSDWVLRSWGECTPRRIDGELVAEEWQLEQVPAPESETLEISVLGGMCAGTDIQTEIVSVDVAETAEAVIVTVWATTPERVESCAGLGRMIPTDVVLESPVGDRPILDGGMVPAAMPRQR
jgi:hypothetical protein